MNTEIINGGSELFLRIRPLWKELRKHHIVKSEYFSDELNQITFDERQAEILSKSISINIDIVLDTDNNKDIAYCITVLNAENIGEIESLFVDKTVRKSGIGKLLMNRSLDWLDSKHVKEKKLGVVVGNEEVFDFYKSFGFFPRSISFSQKK